MPRILLSAVKCATPDESDKDEMFLKMGGKKIWPEKDRFHRLDAGEEVEIGLELDLKEGWNEVELWDYDFISPNDLLGVFKFRVEGRPGEEFSTSMEVLEKGSTASYILEWEML